MLAPQTPTPRDRHVLHAKQWNVRGGTQPAVTWFTFGVLVEGARLASEPLWRL
jgi:hypothetical protein